MKTWPNPLDSYVPIPFARLCDRHLFISLGGGLYAHYIGFLDPEVFTWYYIVTMLIMVLIGGSGTIAGPVIGAILFYLAAGIPPWHQGLSNGHLWPDPGVSHPLMPDESTAF